MNLNRICKHYGVSIPFVKKWGLVIMPDLQSCEDKMEWNGWHAQRSVWRITNKHSGILLEEPVFLGDGACLSESVLLGYKLPGWIMN